MTVPGEVQRWAEPFVAADRHDQMMMAGSRGSAARSGVPISVHGRSGTRHGAGQAWHWTEDAEYVDIDLFLFIETGAGAWNGQSAITRYRALQRATFDRLLGSAGFAGLIAASRGFKNLQISPRAALARETERVK